MAPKRSKKAESVRPVTPHSSLSIKRERLDDEEQTRRVAQRTGDAAAAAPQQQPQQQRAEKSMETLVLDDLNSNDETVLKTALGDIQQLFYRLKNLPEGGAKMQEFLVLGGYATVTRVMKCHLQCPTIQQFGSGVLANASHENLAARTAVGKVRGVQAIVGGMRAHPSTRNTVIAVGIKALWNLTWNHKANATLLVLDIGAMPFVIERMNHFQGDENVTELSCCLLKNLCQFAQLRKSIVAAKAASALSMAIENHENNNEIQEAARGAMTNLMKRP